MADKAPRNNVHCTIPDDPEQSTYRFIIVAAKRAGSYRRAPARCCPRRPRSPPSSPWKRCRRGLVKYSLTGHAPEEPLPEAVL